MPLTRSSRAGARCVPTAPPDTCPKPACRARSPRPVRPAPWLRAVPEGPRWRRQWRRVASSLSPSPSPRVPPLAAASPRGSSPEWPAREKKGGQSSGARRGTARLPDFTPPSSGGQSRLRKLPESGEGGGNARPGLLAGLQASVSTARKLLRADSADLGAPGLGGSARSNWGKRPHLADAPFSNETSPFATRRLSRIQSGAGLGGPVLSNPGLRRGVERSRQRRGGSAWRTGSAEDALACLDCRALDL